MLQKSLTTTKLDGEKLYKFSFNGSVLIALGFVLLYYLIQEKRSLDQLFVFLIIALITSSISLKLGGMWVLYSGSLNIFYTLALALIILYEIQSLHSNANRQLYKKIIIFVSIIFGIVYISSRADYGIAGIILILGIYFSKSKIKWEIAIVCLWGITFYGIIYNNIFNAVFACIGGLVISLYNGKKGLSMKYAFYLFYPVHLFVLGIFNIMFRLNISSVI